MEALGCPEFRGAGKLTLTLLWSILLLPGVIGVMQRGVIEREERYLERTFGATYRQYQARVRRWV